ncbi:M48 family metalloprotease [Pseudodonghicola sp. IC7]|uniref:M48 family metalloprotease n=2 Tax=Pseudodonghicola flavimaris TaxID=3050036 RepID=A0ABT7EVB9_9RHOB|nr:M48 family metalloprotease [Pseudodonghicola flavimaris]MDK3016297.1 M48 family metalloprotease [Pseudodonghicola flavimaris]
MVIACTRRLASIPALLFCALLALAAPRPVAALTLLRDADIEHGLTELSFPILRAAGLNPRTVRVMVVDDDTFNAFVLDHRTIYLHYGLIQSVDSARMLQAVIAHEAAHITNGHIARRMGNMQSARTAAGLGAALAAMAAVAGNGEAAVGLAAGTQSAALRGFLAHTRAEEAAADRAAAGFLTYAGIDPRGLVELHRAFAGQELLSVSNQDVYMQSHPLTRDRLRAAQDYVEAFGRELPADPLHQYWFDRVRGKLSAFTRAPDWTLRRAPEEANADIRLMRQAVAYHRLGRLDAALRAIDGAIALRPEDAYYYDLRGQFLMETRNWAGAVAAYDTANRLAPNEPLILAGLGRAQRAAGQGAAGLDSLEQARSRDFRDARLLHDLALAYAQDGRPGMAALVTAERYALEGRLEDAGPHARRAAMQLPRGSPPWQRAQDVLSASEKLQKRK